MCMEGDKDLCGRRQCVWKETRICVEGDKDLRVWKETVCIEGDKGLVCMAGDKDLCLWKVCVWKETVCMEGDKDLCIWKEGNGTILYELLNGLSWR